MNKVIDTNQASAAIWPYCQAIQKRCFLFIFKQLNANRLQKVSLKTALSL